MRVIPPRCPMAAGKEQMEPRLAEPAVPVLAPASCGILRCSLDAQGFGTVLQFFGVVKTQLDFVLKTLHEEFSNLFPGDHL